MENEIMEIFGKVNDCERFEKFMCFCMEHLARGEEVSEIWSAWNAA